MLLLLSLLLIGMVCPIITQAQELPTEIEFVLHKKMFKDPKYKLEYQTNNGLEKSFSENEVYGLNEVTFQVYDVTHWVKEELQTQTSEDLMTNVLNSKISALQEQFSNDENNPFLQEMTTTSVEGEAGVAAIHVLPRTEKSAYLFLETQAPKIAGQEIHELAAPMLIILPITNPVAEGYLSTIHLYPKNAGFDQPKIPEPPKPEPPKPGKPGKPSLPVTGEAKSMMSLLGMLVIVAALILYKKQRTKD